MIVYGDDHAYRRALRALVPVIETGQLRPMTWRFDALESVTARTYAALDLAKAEVFVVATSRDAGLPPVIEAWIEGAMAGLHRSCGTILALLGSDRRPDLPTTRRYQLLHRVALRAGWDFFAPNQPLLPAIVPCESRPVTKRSGRMGQTRLPLTLGFAAP